MIWANFIVSIYKTDDVRQAGKNIQWIIKSLFTAQKFPLIAWLSSIDWVAILDLEQQFNSWFYLIYHR